MVTPTGLFGVVLSENADQRFFKALPHRIAKA